MGLPHLKGGGPELEVLAVGEGLRGGHHDRVPRVHAQRVKVLHIAHCNAVVAAVAHHLVLDLLPAPQVLVDQDLFRYREGLHLDTRIRVRLLRSNTLNSDILCLSSIISSAIDYCLFVALRSGLRLTCSVNSQQTDRD